MKKLLESIDSMSKAEKKSTGPTFPGYWKGKDPASKAKTKMVGSAEESVIKDLSNALKESTVERKLKEEFANFAESEYQDLRKLQQQWWVALPAIMKKAGIDYHPVKELSRDYYPTLGWINIPGESSSTFHVSANPKGDTAKLNISVDVDTSNSLYRNAQPERAAKLNAVAEKIAQALGGSAAEHMTGQRKNHPGVSHITATMTLPKEPVEWQNPSRNYDPRARFLNTPGERARQSRAARSGFPDSYGGDASNYRLEGVAEGADERKQNALWAQITDYEKRAKATKNDIKKAHYEKMANELRGKLKTSDLDEGFSDMMAKERKKRLAAAEKKKQERRANTGDPAPQHYRDELAQAAKKYKKGVAEGSLEEAVGMMIKGAAISGPDDIKIADQIAAKTGGRVQGGARGLHIVITYPTTQDRAIAAAKIRKMFPDIKLYKTGGNMNAIDEQGVTEGKGGVDTVTMDVPLMIRMLEYAREDAQTDMDLHDVAERMIKLGQSGRTLTMQDYDKICINQEEGVAEAAKGFPHRVRYSYDDPSGSGTASGHYTVNAPDKSAAARYTVSDLTKKGKKNVKVHAVTPQKQDVAEEQEAKYGDKYQAMVKRVGEKAKKKPVDIQALAAKLKAADEKLRQLKEVNTVTPTAPTTQGGAAPATDPQKAAITTAQKNLSKLKTVDPALNPNLANQALQTMATNPNAPVSGAQLAQTKNLADLVGDALADPQKGSQVATMLQQVQQAKK